VLFDDQWKVQLTNGEKASLTIMMRIQAPRERHRRRDSQAAK